MIYSLLVFVSCMLYFCHVCCAFAVCLCFFGVFVIPVRVFLRHLCCSFLCFFTISYLSIDNIVYRFGWQRRAVRGCRLDDRAYSTGTGLEVISLPLTGKTCRFICERRLLYWSNVFSNKNKMNEWMNEWNGREISEWNMEFVRMEWNISRMEWNGRQSSILPNQFHTRFRSWHLQKNV